MNNLKAIANNTHGTIYDGIVTAAKLVASIAKEGTFYHESAMKVLAGKACEDDCEDVMSAVRVFKLDVVVVKQTR